MGWFGVDLDGTAARYDGWVSPTHIGDPVVPMVERVKRWLAEGREVRIVTARAYPMMWLRPSEEPVALLPDTEERKAQAYAAMRAIQDWCARHIGQSLPITCVKDYSMIELWDDRAVQVIPNTGKRADGRE